MARMPGTNWQGEHGTVHMSHYDIVCVHTIVGYAPAHAAHFSVAASGVIYQSRDTIYRSAANYQGNHRVIAVENEDHGQAFGAWDRRDGHAVPPLTQQQIMANAAILHWVHKTHGVPLQLCPNSRPESQGLAYHRQGIDGNFALYEYPGRVEGGEVWTQFAGKVCPGDARIAQLPSILSWAQMKLALEPGEDMPYPVIRCMAVDPTKQADRHQWYALTPTGPHHVVGQEAYQTGVLVGLYRPVIAVNERQYDVALAECRATAVKGT